MHHHLLLMFLIRLSLSIVNFSLRVPHTKLALSYRSFRIAAPTIWNTLPVYNKFFSEEHKNQLFNLTTHSDQPRAIEYFINIFAYLLPTPTR